MDPLGYQHKHVQRLRRLVRRRSARDDDRAFVLEGIKVLEEAVAAGAHLDTVFVDLGFEHPVIDRALHAGARVRTLDRGVLERVAGTVTPQPVIAVAPYVDVSLDRVSAADSIVVVAALRDPGNAGTVLRSAEGAGVGGVVFCDGSVDVFNPKTVRASAGSIFHVPVVRGGEVTQVLDELQRWGLRRLAAVAHGGRPHDSADLGGRIALVVGNEAHGLSDESLGHVDERVTIPLEGRSESLNVGMATAVLVFEMARQRRAGRAA